MWILFPIISWKLNHQKEREGNKKKLKKTKNVHVAKHYAKGEIKQDQHLCVFCGKIGCSIGLELTSGKGRNANYNPKSDCKLLINNFWEFFIKN